VTGDISAEDIARLNAGRDTQDESADSDTSRLALPNAQDA
jgi:amidophosphoribosyltransferase